LLVSSEGRLNLSNMQAGFFGKPPYPRGMKRVSFVPAAACLCATACAGPAFPDVSKLPSDPNPPDPLIMLDGQKVATPGQWFEQRRPELKALFQHYMYGWFPPPVQVHGVVTYADARFFNGQATLKLVTLKLAAPGAPEIRMLMVIPNHRAGPAPVFLGMNFGGNHSLVTDTNVPLPASWMPGNGPYVVNHHATEAGRGTEIHVWELEQSVQRGYAVATFFHGDVEPDDSHAVGGVRETIHRPAASDDWGTIAAWAWGLQRAVDYLLTDADIDRKRIALVGHSRFGKTALLAAAFDERVALVAPLQAGCGGTAPSRGAVGESVQQINTTFPYWFCGEFKKFNTQPDRLPFDQHCLIALCAPRPVLLGAAAEDTWANPAGAFDMLKAADKVYRLLGAGGLPAQTMPEPDKLVAGNLGFFIRPGQHSMTRLDWRYFLDFADQQWGKP
jgi:dienelactone hydrolase